MTRSSCCECGPFVFIPEAVADVPLAEESALFNYAEPGRSVYAALGASL